VIKLDVTCDEAERSVTRNPSEELQPRLGIGQRRRCRAKRRDRFRLENDPPVRTGLSNEQLLSMPSVLSGSPGEMADTLSGLREKYGLTSFTAQDNNLDSFAKVIVELR